MSLDRSKGHRGTAAFIVEKGTTGFTFGKKEHKIGIRASTAYELVFENCRIPEENLLLKDNYKPYEKESARAKLFASECAMAVTTKAVQIFGGYNYTTIAFHQNFYAVIARSEMAKQSQQSSQTTPLDCFACARNDNVLEKCYTK